MAEQVVIVTGASRGLGAATARILAGMGARLVINARSEGPLLTLVDEIRAADGQAVAVRGDVSDPAVCRAIVQAALDRFGRLDALVNNAGIIEPIAPLAEATGDAWARNLAVNVIGPVLMTAAALPHLRARSGRVISVSSGAAISPKSGWGAYCAAKAALNQFNAVLALEEPQITAITFRPGVVDTEMQAAIRREGAGKMAEDEHARFVGYFEQGELPPPEVPGRALAALALHAPREWSGEFIRWDEDRVAALVGE